MLTIQQQTAALLLLQEVTSDSPTWDSVTAAVSQAAQAQGYTPDVAAEMGQFAAHQMGLKIAREGGKPRGGARQGAGRRPYPQLRPGAVVIDVRNCWVVVSRWVRTGGGFQLEPARNWEALQAQATDEIVAIGGASNLSAIYPCSPALVALAQWPE